MYGYLILHTFNYLNTLPAQLVWINEVPLYFIYFLNLVFLYVCDCSIRETSVLDPFTYQSVRVCVCVCVTISMLAL